MRASRIRAVPRVIGAFYPVGDLPQKFV